MPCKPGVAGSILGFSMKTSFGEPLGVPVIKPTQIFNQPGGTGLYPGKPQKVFLGISKKRSHRGEVDKCYAL